MSTSYTFCVEVTVNDETALHSAAFNRVVEEMSHLSYADVIAMIGSHDEPNVEVCLTMLFDPGVSPPGCKIEESRCE